MSVRGAAAAAFSVEKAYQFASKTPGRDPSRPFTQATFSDYNNNMRIDIALSALGAWYGATSVKSQRSISQKQVDIAFGRTFSGSKSLALRPKLNKSNFSLNDIPLVLKLYPDWKKMINPDQSYFYFAQQFGY